MTPTVIVVGSINVDLVTRVERLPHPGETVIGGEYTMSHGGKGANQAVAAARLGARVFLVGMLGDDDLGRAARDELEEEGVILDEIRTGISHTGVAQILVDAAGENLIAVASGVNDELSASMVTESLARIAEADPVVLSVLEVPDAAVEATATAAGRRGWRFVLNPAPARPLDDGILAHTDLLTPNEHEVEGLGRRSPDELLSAGVRAVVVTSGKQGADLFRPGAPAHHQAAFDVSSVDTTGAGDAFSAGMAVAMAQRRGLEDSVRFAAACGALATRKMGARAGLPSPADVDLLIHGGRPRLRARNVN
jgi:ribokinase